MQNTRLNKRGAGLLCQYTQSNHDFTITTARTTETETTATTEIPHPRQKHYYCQQQQQQGPSTPPHTIPGMKTTTNTA